jgi:hypothetical protein
MLQFLMPIAALLAGGLLIVLLLVFAELRPDPAPQGEPIDQATRRGAPR